MHSRLENPTQSIAFLSDQNFRLSGTGVASDYAQKLLLDLGATGVSFGDSVDTHPAIAWAESGLMWLTGQPGADPLLCPAPVVSCAEGVLMALAALPGGRRLNDASAVQLLSERAAILNLSRQGAISASGHCRILQADGGWIAVNLAREADWELLPAWFQQDCPHADWNSVGSLIAKRHVDELLERANLLGLPVAEIVMPESRTWLRIERPGGCVVRRERDRPLVVDLSSLWAGPLTGQLLRQLGARVIKVEDRQRPDGARGGAAAFYQRVNDGNECLALELSSTEGQSALRQLLGRADIVIESARPRALRQMGIEASELVANQPGLTWISITGYGRGPNEENRVAFGDDAAVAGGFGWLMHESCGEYVFCGDAVADPLTGLHAAVAGWASWLSGQGGLLDVSLRDVASHVCTFQTPLNRKDLAHRIEDWNARLQEADVLLKRPVRGHEGGLVYPLGAHNRALSAEFGIAC